MAQRQRRIVREIKDEPHIKGHRLTVRWVHEVYDGGLSAAEIANEWDLDLADVYHALAYYYDHPKEMRKIERRRQRRIEDGAETAITGPEDVE